MWCIGHEFELQATGTDGALYEFDQYLAAIKELVLNLHHYETIDFKYEILEPLIPKAIAFRAYYALWCYTLGKEAYKSAKQTYLSTTDEDGDTGGFEWLLIELRKHPFYQPDLQVQVDASVPIYEIEISDGIRSPSVEVSPAPAPPTNVTNPAASRTLVRPRRSRNRPAAQQQLETIAATNTNNNDDNKTDTNDTIMTENKTDENGDSTNVSVSANDDQAPRLSEMFNVKYTSQFFDTSDTSARNMKCLNRESIVAALIANENATAANIDHLINDKFNNVELLYDGRIGDDDTTYIDDKGSDDYKLDNNDGSSCILQVADLIYHKSLPAAPLMKVFKIQQGILHNQFLIDVILLGENLQQGIMKSVASNIVQTTRRYS